MVAEFLGELGKYQTASEVLKEYCEQKPVKHTQEEDKPEEIQRVETPAPFEEPSFFKESPNIQRLMRERRYAEIANWAERGSRKCRSTRTSG